MADNKVNPLLQQKAVIPKALVDNSATLETLLPKMDELRKKYIMGGQPEREELAQIVTYFRLCRQEGYTMAAEKRAKAGTKKRGAPKVITDEKEQQDILDGLDDLLGSKK